MAQTHKVLPGDTLSSIAKRFNVPVTAVSGYRSNNPNVIFPGEELTIADVQQPNQPQAPTTPQIPQPNIISPDGTALQPTGALPQPTQQPIQTTPQPVQATTPPVQQPQATQPTQPQLPQAPTDEVTAKQTKEVQLPSGLTVDIDAQGNIIDAETGEIITDPKEEEAKNLFGGFGISTDDVSEGLRTNPFGTLSAIMQTIMQQAGIPELRSNITNIAKEIEDLENERDAEIQKIQDNPFFSSGSKSERIAKIRDKYEQRITNRTNRLTLLQGAQQEARQQAQFVTNSAIQLFGLQLSDQQKQEALDAERNERLLEAVQKLDEPLSVAEAKSLGVPFGTTAREARGITPKGDGVDITETVTDPTTGEPLAFGTPEYVVQRLLQSANSKTKPAASERENLGKFQRVIAQVSGLSESLNKTGTDPIVGKLREFNPYDFDARAVNAQINALVPNVARGVYGEVGVLTDTDIERYLQTLPNIRGTKAQNDFVTALTLRNAMRAFETDLITLASSGVNVSGFVDTYQNINKQVKDLESKLGIGQTFVPSEDIATFDDVVGEQTGGNYWAKLFGAFLGR